MPKTLARGQGMAWMRKRAFIRGYAPSEGGGASQYAPFAAPAGYRWDFVVDETGASVNDNNLPVIDLVRAA